MRYGCLIQAVLMMILLLAALFFYEYGFDIPAGALGLGGLGVMAWGAWSANRKSRGD
ncbi:hypothetical protein M7784_13155 [Desulfovibrio aminophilus]|nr:hypothetical protein [Desulfovibrio aminophilus]MCM0756182.1 hypothetical protein [Desulfovibrio aminophilus]